MTLNHHQEATSPRSQARRVGTRIRAARKEHGLTQSQLADRLDITIPTLRKLEAGDTSINLHTFLSGLSILGIALDVLHRPVERSYRPLPRIPSRKKNKFSKRLKSNGINSRDAENAAWILSLSDQQRIRLLKTQEKEQELCGIALR